jgi:hypothetical protein
VIVMMLLMLQKLCTGLMDGVLIKMSVLKSMLLGSSVRSCFRVDVQSLTARTGLLSELGDLLFLGQ